MHTNGKTAKTKSILKCESLRNTIFAENDSVMSPISRQKTVEFGDNFNVLSTAHSVECAPRNDTAYNHSVLNCANNDDNRHYLE